MGFIYNYMFLIKIFIYVRNDEPCRTFTETQGSPGSSWNLGFYGHELLIRPANNARCYPSPPPGRGLGGGQTGLNPPHPALLPRGRRDRNECLCHCLPFFSVTDPRQSRGLP